MELKLKKKVLFGVDRVTFQYPGTPKPLFENLSFAIGYKESVAFLIPDGHGRTTLLKLLSAMEKPDSGRVFVNEFPAHHLPDEVLSDYRAQIGFIFPDGALINNLTIHDNVALPLRYHGNMDEDHVRHQVRKTLAFFHLEACADQRPAFVSAYERKIAGIARGFIMTPPVFFFDNVFHGLTRRQTIDISLHLRNALSESEGTFIFTGSDPEILQHHAKRVLFLSQGHLIFDGTFDQLYRSQEVAIQSFLKDSMMRAA